MARPREFDVDEAIEIATGLFCERGYQATSISDLTDALGILRGSLYKVFPDKHSLLLTALDRYRIAQLDDLQRKLTRSASAAEGLRAALLDWAEQSAGSSGRRGCLISHLALELVPGDSEVTERIQRHYQQMAEILEDALHRMRLEGTLSAGISIPTLGQLLISTLQGLRVVGKTRPLPMEVRESILLLLGLLTDQSEKLKFHTASAN